MKAITVWQPWATLLATGQKHNETRSWKTSYRGEILIHAAKTDHSGILLHIPMEELKHFQDAGVVNKLPTGAIIGKASRNRMHGLTQEQPCGAKVSRRKRKRLLPPPQQDWQGSPRMEKPRRM